MQRGSDHGTLMKKSVDRSRRVQTTGPETSVAERIVRPTAGWSSKPAGEFAAPILATAVTLILVDSFFGTPWDDLDLGDVERFLTEDAEAEGLTWEAKGADPRGGGDRPHRDAVRKHVSAFANSELGGFYILGAARAQRNSGPWRLDPLDFGGEEPTTWLSRVIRNGVNPVPPNDVREWEHEGGHVAVLRIDPVTEPPCMTMSGEVFTRVSGESVPVTDAATLRRLYTRGEERIERAVRNARYSARPERELRVGPTFGVGPLGIHVAEPPAEMRIRVAFVPVGVEESTDRRVLRESFATRVVEAARTLPAAPLFPYPGYTDFATEMNRNAIVASDVTAANPQRWRVEVETDGTVVVSLTITVDRTDRASLLAHAVVEDALRPAVGTATKLASEAGGYGRGYLVVSVVGRAFELLGEGSRRGQLPGIPDFLLTASANGPREYREGLEAWIDAGAEPTDTLLAGMERELLRECGIAAWEPEPADEAAPDAPAQTS
jgi:hypothetical protein